jgi:hypothetical protein
MKHGQFVSLAVAVPALLLGACGGGAKGVGTTDVMTGGAAGAGGDDTGATATAGTGDAAGTGATGTAGTVASGTAGTGATVDCSMDMGTTDDTISDFEDGTGSVLPSEGRNGGWYTYVDGAATCMVMPPPNGSATAAEIPGGRCQSMFAMHFSGTGCTVFGAGVGTDLAAPAATADAGTSTPTAKVPYDVSGFTGISFWSRADKGVSMFFKMPMTDETTTTDGGTCVDSTTAKCSDDFGANIALTKNWIKHTVMFSTMKQQGWGKVFPWNPAHVTSIQFQVPMTAPFDLWIDDVSFVK